MCYAFVYHKDIFSVYIKIGYASSWILNENNKEGMRDRITLPQPMWEIKETTTFNINNNRKKGTFNSLFNKLNERKIKSKQMQNVVDKIPINVIVCFGYIKFKDNVPPSTIASKSCRISWVSKMLCEIDILLRKLVWLVAKILWSKRGRSFLSNLEIDLLENIHRLIGLIPFQL